MRRDGDIKDKNFIQKTLLFVKFILISFLIQFIYFFFLGLMGGAKPHIRFKNAVK